MQYASMGLRFPLAGILLLLAVPCAVMVTRVWGGRLERAHRLGLHTPAAVASDEAFALANRIAAPLVAGGAAVGAICAILVLALPLGVTGAVTVSVLGLVGLFGQLFAASTMGERAARTVPRPARRSSVGACCGSCDCGGSGCDGGSTATGADIPDLVADASTARA